MIDFVINHYLKKSIVFQPETYNSRWFSSELQDVARF